jgi:hypothetical protein
VSYAILDNNRFYAEGLRYALLSGRSVRGPERYRTMAANAAYPPRDCRPLPFFRGGDASGADQYFAQAGSRPLERQSLSGLQRKGWALATHLRKRFSTLTLYIIDDRIAVADAAYLLAKKPVAFEAWIAA